MNIILKGREDCDPEWTGDLPEDFVNPEEVRKPRTQRMTARQLG